MLLISRGLRASSRMFCYFPACVRVALFEVPICSSGIEMNGFSLALTSIPVSGKSELNPLFIFEVKIDLCSLLKFNFYIVWPR